MAKTFGDPDVIDPASAESPILPIALLFTNTLPDPAFITAECVTEQPLPVNLWTTVGSPCRSIPLLLANTLPEGPVKVVDPSHPCPVAILSPILATAGIMLI